MSYQINDRSYAFGTFDSVCNHLDAVNEEEDLSEDIWALSSIKLTEFETTFEDSILEMEKKTDEEVGSIPTDTTDDMKLGANSKLGAIIIVTPPKELSESADNLVQKDQSMMIMA